MALTFRYATLEDADDLVCVQNLSFHADYIRYGGCPGYNRTRESMADSIGRHHVFAIALDGELIGDISVHDLGGGHYHLGCLCVVPQYENQGIGHRGLNFLDTQFPDAVHWSLETPADKTRNHYFYQKHGFDVTKAYMDGTVEIVLFEKDVEKS